MVTSRQCAALLTLHVRPFSWFGTQTYRTSTFTDKTTTEAFASAVRELFKRALLHVPRHRWVVAGTHVSTAHLGWDPHSVVWCGTVLWLTPFLSARCVLRKWLTVRALEVGRKAQDTSTAGTLNAFDTKTAARQRTSQRACAMSHFHASLVCTRGERGSATGQRPGHPVRVLSVSSGHPVFVKNGSTSILTCARIQAVLGGCYQNEDLVHSVTSLVVSLGGRRTVI